MSKVTRAIILAAGVGSRLKTLTQHTPKALMPVAGQAAIAHVIRHLVEQGIHDIAINIHHHAEQVRSYLGDGKQYNARFYFSYEHQLLNSGGGARTALDLLPDSGLVAIHNADILAQTPIHQLAKLCPQAGCALALVPNPKHHPAGDFVLHGKRILAPNAFFSSKSGNNAYTFSGVSVWHQDALLAYQAQQSFSLVKPIKASIKQQRCLGLLYSDLWFDIGRQRDLIQANRQLSLNA